MSMPLSYAARVIPFQNASTVLTRSVLDHASITTNPRWAVVQGGLINPREMVPPLTSISRTIKGPVVMPIIWRPSVGVTRRDDVGVHAA